MAQFKCPIDFIPLQQVTAANLNSHVNNATAEPGLVHEQDAIPEGPLQDTDTVLAYDNSTGLLAKIDAPKFTSSGFPVTTNTITGNAGSDVVINPEDGQKVDINSPLEAHSISVSGRIATSSTGAMRIPVGTTDERPAAPVIGDMRYNTTDLRSEIYDGTAWKAMGTAPFEATGGTVTTANLWRTHIFTASGSFETGAIDGDVELLVVAGGGGGASGKNTVYTSGISGAGSNVYAPGGGGGEVVYNANYTCTRNTTYTVIIGSGGLAGIGSDSPPATPGGTTIFGPITAAGGEGGFGNEGGI